MVIDYTFEKPCLEMFGLLVIDYNLLSKSQVGCLRTGRRHKKWSNQDKLKFDDDRLRYNFKVIYNGRVEKLNHQSQALVWEIEDLVGGFIGNGLLVMVFAFIFGDSLNQS
ncbi:hypothetical protein GmHk_04G010079 [Glycine max]|nr:hypothetical protein GmHk_04G010079 [Glycine max]